MKPLIIFTIIFFVNQSIAAQASISDTLKVVAQTKFGEITFIKYCKTDKLEFVQSGKPIFNENVESEARIHNVRKYKLKLKFTIDNFGKLISCQIIKSSRLKVLDSHLLEVFNEAISNIKEADYTLNCDKKGGTYVIPAIYKPRKLE